MEISKGDTVILAHQDGRAAGKFTVTDTVPELEAEFLAARCHTCVEYLVDEDDVLVHRRALKSQEYSGDEDF